MTHIVWHVATSHTIIFGTRPRSPVATTLPFGCIAIAVISSLERKEATFEKKNKRTRKKQETKK